MTNSNTFPDGTPIDSWFFDTKKPSLSDFKNQYKLTDYNIKSDGKLYTKEIQSLIDTANQNDGGVIIIPAGEYLSGALFFKQGVSLYLEKDAVLKGSDDIYDYPILDTRIEGESCKYFSAFINADNVDGFCIFGEGTIDGNGYKSWRAFWLRQEWNPACTNKDEQRPRLVYISNSKNVILSDITLQNSHFWTSHIYKSEHIKYLNVSFYSPHEPVKAPSTDAIDLDVCHDVLVKDCYMSVNDDAMTLKGGKGPYADEDPSNGSNERIIVEDCSFGFCHAALTCGSESVHDRNVIFRRCKAKGGYNFLRLKMRPDTPSHYEYILIEDCSAKMASFVNINPWTQFYNLGTRKTIPLSNADNITIKNCSGQCITFFDVKKAPDQYLLSNFNFENIVVEAEVNGLDSNLVNNIELNNVDITLVDRIDFFDELKKDTVL